MWGGTPPGAPAVQKVKGKSLMFHTRAPAPAIGYQPLIMAPEEKAAVPGSSKLALTIRFAFAVVVTSLVRKHTASTTLGQIPTWLKYLRRSICVWYPVYQFTRVILGSE